MTKLTIDKEEFKSVFYSYRSALFWKTDTRDVAKDVIDYIESKLAEAYEQGKKDATAPEGWKLVLLAPTEEMVAATFSGMVEDQDMNRQIARRAAMKETLRKAIEASPEYKGEPT